MEESQSPSLKNLYNVKDFKYKSLFLPEVHLKTSRKRLFNEASITLNHLYGYQSFQGSNLCVLDDKIIVIAAGCYMVILDVDTNSQLFHRTLSGNGIYKMVAHPTRQYFAVSEKVSKVYVNIYSYPDMELCRIVKDEKTEQPCIVMEFQSEGDLFATISKYPENGLILWQWKTESKVFSAIASGWSVYNISFSNFNSNVFTTCGEKQIKFWEIEAINNEYKLKKEHVELLQNKELRYIKHIVHLPNDTFIGGSENGYIFYWKDVFSKNCLTEKIGKKSENKNITSCHQGSISKIFLTSNLIVTLGMDGWIYLWNYQIIARKLRSLNGEGKYLEMEPIDQIQVSDSAQLIHGIPTTLKKDIGLWYVQDITGSIWKVDISPNRLHCPPKQLLHGYGQSMSGLDVCKELPLIAVSSKSGSVTIYHSTKLEELCTKSFNAGITCLIWPNKSFDNKGFSILTGFEDGTIRWIIFAKHEEYYELRLCSVFKPHSKALVGIGCKYNGSIVATCGQDHVIFLFTVIKKLKLNLVPLGFYELDVCHVVKWMIWIKKPKQYVNESVKPESEFLEMNDKAEKENEKKNKELGSAEQGTAPSRESSDIVIPEELAFPLKPDSKIKKTAILSDESSISLQTEKFSTSSSSHSDSSLPYEEEEEEKPLTLEKITNKQKRKIPDGKRAVFKTDNKTIKPDAPRKMVNTKLVKPSTFVKKMLESQITETILLCCEGSYFLEFEPPEKGNIAVKNKTYRLPYDNVQIYKIETFKAYHDLGDRIFDSDDEAHPDRSDLVKQYFREMKYAEKKAERRRKRRYQKLGKQTSSPDIITWLPSEKLGYLWLSLGEYDFGFLFECPFFGSKTREPVNIIPERAVELLTSDCMRVESMCISSCGEFVFLGQRDGALSICRLAKKFDISTGFDFAKFNLHDSVDGIISFTKLTPDGNSIITAGTDGNVFQMSINFSKPKNLIMTWPIKELLPEEQPDIIGSSLSTIEEVLAKNVRLEIMDKITSTLTEIQNKLPKFKEQYRNLKNQHEKIKTAASKLPEGINFQHNIDISKLGAHPKFVMAFNIITERSMNKISSEYKDPICQWSSYLSKLKEAFEVSIQAPIEVYNFMTGETVHNFVEPHLPPDYLKDEYLNVKHNPDVLKYKKYCPDKTEFVSNTRILNYLNDLLRKTKENIVDLSEGIPLTQEIINYNKRKMDNIRRIVQRKRFEEINQLPVFKREDEYFKNEKENIEKQYYKFKTDPDVDYDLPKNIQYTPDQKKKIILAYLNKMHNLLYPYNCNVKYLEKMYKCFENWDLGLGEKETVHKKIQKEKETEEAIKSIREIMDGILHTVTKHIEFKEDSLLTEEESKKIINSNFLYATEYNMYKLSDLEKEIDNLFNTKFTDDERYYQTTPNLERDLLQPLTSDTELLKDSPVDIHHESFEIHKSMEPLSNKYEMKTYKMDGQVLHVSITKPNFPKRQSLTKDVIFKYSHLPLLHEDLSKKRDNKGNYTDSNFIEAIKSHYFIKLDPPEKIENLEKAFKKDEILLKKQKLWRYFNNMHRVMVILRYKIDCEKKYQDLVYNWHCRELNIIEQTHFNMQSINEKINEQEVNVHFECIKLELLEQILKYTKRQIEKLQSRSDKLFDEFITKLDHGKQAFYKNFLKLNPKLEQTQPIENKQEFAESHEKSMMDMNDDFLDDDEDNMNFNKPEQQSSNYEIYKKARGIQKELYQMQLEIKGLKVRLTRCENKKQVFLKKVKKLRSAISETMPELSKIYSTMKTKLDEELVQIISYPKRIECEVYNFKPTLNLSRICKQVTDEINDVNELIEKAVRDIENLVIGYTLRELGRIARTLLTQYIKPKAITGTQNQTESLLNNTPLKQKPNSLQETENHAPIKSAHNKKTKNECDRYEGCSPEMETEIIESEIINTGLTIYEDYSKNVEGDYYLFPEYFVHSIQLNHETDMNLYEEAKSCTYKIIDNVEEILNNIDTVVINDTLSKIVHEIVRITESQNLTENKTVHKNLGSLELFQLDEMYTNFGGGLLYDLDILNTLQISDPQHYDYPSFFQAYERDTEIKEQKKTSSDLSLDDADEEIQTNFESIIEGLVVISKSNVDRIRKMFDYIRSVLKQTQNKDKKWLKYLTKLIEMNNILEIFNKNLKYKIEAKMLNKLSRTVDLEALMDTLQNPHYHIMKYKTDKELEPLKKKLHDNQKILTVKKKQLNELIYNNHRLWIELANIQNDLNVRKKFFNKNKMILPKISSTYGPSRQ